MYLSYQRINIDLHVIIKLILSSTLEKEMAAHPSMLAWEIPCTEEPGGLQSMGSPRVRRDSATKHTCITHLLYEHWLPCNKDVCVCRLSIVSDSLRPRGL